MKDKGIILVSPDSDINSFVDSDEETKFPYTYYLDKVIYVLNIEVEDDYEYNLALIINPSEIDKNNKEEALKIWKEIALEE